MQQATPWFWGMLSWNITLLLGLVIVGGLSPAVHPAMNRVPVAFEPIGLGGATGRGAEPVV
jgi:hypothetical protein